ncbi:MAG TPA: AI-2E family transporter [Rickettsiales bacterium]|nr:AI-2E family transporter [Rickettsiales bacterium]
MNKKQLMDKSLKQKIILSTLLIFTLFFFYSVRNILLPFVLGGLIAYLLKNSVNKFGTKIKSKKLVATTFVSIFSILILLFFAFVIPVLLNQTAQMFKELANYITKNSDFLGDKITQTMQYFAINTDEINIKTYIANYSTNIAGYSINLLNGILSKSIAFISLISLLIITPITAYYFLMEWDNIMKHIYSYIPKSKQNTAKTLFKNIDSVLSGCLKGQLNVCGILGLFYGILLMLSGLKYGFIIGLLTGLASFIPYFGMLIGFATGLIMTLYQFGFDITHIILTSGIFIIGQILEGNFITPKLVGNKIHLHPLWIIFALFSGGTLFGFYGLLLALPIAGIIGVLIRFCIAQCIVRK